MSVPPSVRLCVRPSTRLEQFGFRWTDVDEILHLSFLFRKPVEKIQVSLFRTRNVSNKDCRENQNTRFTSSNFFFRKSFCLWDNVEKCDGAREAEDDNMTARCVLD